MLYRCTGATAGRVAAASEMTYSDPYHGIDSSPDGAFVWTANRATNDLTVIDTESRAVLETITAVEGANHLTISPDGSTVYATAPGTDETFVVDSRTVELIDRADVGQEPHEIVFRSDP